MLNRWSFGYHIRFAPPDETGSGAASGSSQSAGSSGSSTGGNSSGPSSPGASSSPSGSDPVSPSLPGPSGGTTPGSTASPPPAGPGSSSDLDFMSIFEESPPSAATLPLAAPAAPVTPPVPGLPAAMTAPAVPPPPVQPGSQPATPGSPASAQSDTSGTQPQQQVPQLNPADPIGLAEALGRNEAAAIEQLSTSVFALSPQELSALETDPASAIPKLLARAVVFSTKQTLSQMGRIIPEMLRSHAQVAETHNRQVGQFYSAWPSIDRTKHHEAVKSAAITFRQLNPDVPTDKMIETIGPYILMQLGLPLVPMTRPGAQAASASPQRPGPPNGSRPTSFVPAAPGAVAVQQPVAVPDAYAFLGQSGD